MSAIEPSPAAPMATPRVSEALAITAAFLVAVVGGIVAAFAWSTTAGAVMLVLAGACFFGLYARGHLARPPEG